MDEILDLYELAANKLAERMAALSFEADIEADCDDRDGDLSPKDLFNLYGGEFGLRAKDLFNAYITMQAAYANSED